MQNPSNKNRLKLSWLAILILLILSFGAQAAEISAIRKYIETEEINRFDKLLSEFGENKELPPGYELQALLALSHYPELKSVRIRFIVEDVGIPLSSRPHWPSLFRSAKNRTYLVVIDSDIDGPRDVLLLKNQPFNAQVGIIGHELSHTVYYLDLSFFGIAADAVCQFSNCRINFERATDRRLISYGLGWQRYDHALFVRRRLAPSQEASAVSEEGGGAYMTPTEILHIIEGNESYPN